MSTHSDLCRLEQMILGTSHALRLTRSRMDRVLAALASDGCRLAEVSEDGWRRAIQHP